MEATANIIPVLGPAADVLMVGQLAETVSEFHQLDVDTKAALDFLAKGPYSLQDLRVSPNSESFTSFDAFKKGPPFLQFHFKRFGSAGDGYDYHHVVEQGGGNASAFSAEELQSTNNIVRIPTLLHEAINSEYSAKSKELTESTLRQRLQSLSFSEQQTEGINVLRKLGIIQ